MKFVTVPELEASLLSTMQITVLSSLLIYIFLLSLIGFGVMAWDKHKATHNKWRISEITLLLWAFFGGAIGAKAAQRLLNHKTRKQPFAITLNIAFVWNVLIYIVLLIPPSRYWLIETLINYANT